MTKICIVINAAADVWGNLSVSVTTLQCHHIVIYVLHTYIYIHTYTHAYIHRGRKPIYHEAEGKVLNWLKLNVTGI